MTKSSSEVARLFNAGSVSLKDVDTEVDPGYPGRVIAQCTVRSMTWGFPMAMTDKSGQPTKPKPVNNTRAGKLDSVFWRYSFEVRRCLIPMTAFAEAEGPRAASPALGFRCRARKLSHVPTSGATATNGRRFTHWS